MKKRTKWILWPALGALVLGSVGWVTLRSGKEEAAFTVEAVRRQELKESITANGEIQALTRVNVGTSITEKIADLHVKDGAEVQGGALLVTLEQERYKQQLTQADLGLRSAKEDLRSAEATFLKQQTTFKRKETLHAQGLLSSEEFQDAKLALNGADTALQRAKVGVQQGEAQVALGADMLAKTVIRAPMAGRVTSLKAEKGETAVAGQTSLAGAVLMVISDMSVMLAEIKVGELDVVKLRTGQPAEVTVDAFPGKLFQGKVLDVASSVDKSSQGGYSSQDAQTYRVRVVLEGEEVGALRPGMSARVAVLANRIEKALSIPLQAVQERESRSGTLGLLSGTRQVVYVVKDGKVEERPFKAGLTTRRALEVLEGVKEGEQVITGPAKAMLALGNGQKVKLAEPGKS
jgi:HlyD family secretion protein